MKLKTIEIKGLCNCGINNFASVGVKQKNRIDVRSRKMVAPNRNVSPVSFLILGSCKYSLVVSNGFGMAAA